MAGRQQGRITLAIAIAASLWAGAVMAGNRAVFTSPHCKNYRFEEAIEQNDGTKRETKLGHAFCTDEDYESLRARTKTTPMLDEIFGGHGFVIQQVTLASYKFIDDELAESICHAHKKNPFKVRMIRQQSFMDRLNPQVIMDTLKNCLGDDLTVIDIGCDVFMHKFTKDETLRAQQDALCKDVRKDRSLPVQTMHMKMITASGIKDGKPTTYIVAGSGNLGRGLYSNFDDWMLLRTDTGSILDRQHQCMIQTVMRSGTQAMTPAEVAKDYEQCIGKDMMASAQGAIAVFLPSGAAWYSQQMVDAVAHAKSIVVATEEFASAPLRDAILAAHRRGVPVRIIMDDNTYGCAVRGVNYNSQSINKYYTYIAPLLQEGVPMRFLETNEGASSQRNIMHHRFLVTDDGKQKRLFTGSTHIKDMAMETNFENQYVFNDPQMTEAYMQEFNMLWLRALPWEKMPKFNKRVILQPKTATLPTQE